MITIRDMTIKDVDQVCALEEMAFSMPWHKESFIEMIENKDAMYLVVETDEKTNAVSRETDFAGGIVACCGLRHIVGEGDISNVVVHPDYRKQGIAFQMLTELLLRSQKKYGIDAYTLEVRQSNTGAIHLYEKLGFVQEGIRKNFYENPVENAVIMWKR